MSRKTDEDELPLNPDINADELFMDMTLPASVTTEPTPGAAQASISVSSSSPHPEPIPSHASDDHDRRGPQLGRRASDAHDWPGPRTGRRVSDVDAGHRFHDVWATLRAIDCSNLARTTEGGVHWCDILDLLMVHFPDTAWETLPDVHHADGSMEVGCIVTINGVSRSTNLQVDSASGSLLVKPNAQQVNEARMRCWMRCVALFGLGLDIEAGSA